MEDQKINIYEITFLAIDAAGVDAVKKNLAGLSAEIVTEGPAAERQLAYPIDKRTSALFGYIHFKMLSANVKPLNDALTLDKSILRFLIITPIPAKPLPKKTDAPTRPVKKPAANDLSNEALEEKLAALQGK